MTAKSNSAFIPARPRAPDHNPAVFMGVFPSGAAGTEKAGAAQQELRGTDPFVMLYPPGLPPGPKYLMFWTTYIRAAPVSAWGRRLWPPLQSFPPAIAWATSTDGDVWNFGGRSGAGLVLRPPYDSPAPVATGQVPLGDAAGVDTITVMRFANGAPPQVAIPTINRSAPAWIALYSGRPGRQVQYNLTNQNTETGPQAFWKNPAASREILSEIFLAFMNGPAPKNNPGQPAYWTRIGAGGIPIPAANDLVTPATPVLAARQPPPRLTRQDWDDNACLFKFDGGILEPSIIYDGTKFIMFYTWQGNLLHPQAPNGRDVTRSYIGRVESTDLLNWTRIAQGLSLPPPPAGKPTNAVLQGDAGTWDGGNVRQCCVVPGNGGLHMFYQGSPLPGEWLINGRAWKQIGHAFSTDGGRTWIKNPNNPIVRPDYTVDSVGALTGPRKQLRSPSALIDPATGKWNLWYRASEASPGRLTHRIYHTVQP